MSKASDMMRAEWSVNDAKRDAGLTTPEDVERFDDIVYGPDPVWNVLDVYRPKNEKGILPAIVPVHGGGWVYGDKQLYQFYTMSLAQRGFAVINFTYGLAPEFKFPSQLADTNRVMEWMFDNAEKYGLDTRNVFMVGDSAGAHLLALYTNICTNPACAASYPFKVPHNFVPTAIALNCGAYRPMDWHEIPENNKDSEEEKSAGNAQESGDKNQVLNTDTTVQLMKDLLPGSLTRETLRQIDVTEFMTAAYPPLFVMTAYGDQTVGPEQVKALLSACDAKNIPYTHREYGNAEHPLYHVFHVAVQEPMGQKCNDDECEFFRKQMNK